MHVEVIQSVGDSQDLVKDALRWAESGDNYNNIPTDEDQLSDFAHNQTHSPLTSMATL